MLYEAFEDAHGCCLRPQQREILRVRGEGADPQVVGLVAGRERVAPVIPLPAASGSSLSVKPRLYYRRGVRLARSPPLRVSHTRFVGVGIVVPKPSCGAGYQVAGEGACQYRRILNLPTREPDQATSLQVALV